MNGGESQVGAASPIYPEGEGSVHLVLLCWGEGKGVSRGKGQGWLRRRGEKFLIRNAGKNKPSLTFLTVHQKKR